MRAFNLKGLSIRGDFAAIEKASTKCNFAATDTTGERGGCYRLIHCGTKNQNRSVAMVRCEMLLNMLRLFHCTKQSTLTSASSKQFRLDRTFYIHSIFRLEKYPIGSLDHRSRYWTYIMVSFAAH